MKIIEKIMIFRRISLLLIAMFCFLFTKVYSQVSTKDSIVSGFLIHFRYGNHIPGGDLSERFGSNFAVGTTVMYKNKHNFLFGIDYGYIFGNNVKNEEQYLKNILTSDGFIIDGDGLYTEVFFHQRGFYSTASIGKLFTVIGPNPNSGIWLALGGGMLQHKITLMNSDNTVNYFSKEYKKGYDRMANGACLKQQLGYFHIGNKKSYSFNIAFEFIQAFTKPRRNYQYDLMGKEHKNQRIDLMYGITFSWMIPLFKQSSDGYFYN
jgi:hypothetical protein